MNLFSFRCVGGVLLLTVTGCSTLQQAFRSPQEEHISAVTFSDDPVVRQLAIAVERGDNAGIEAAMQHDADVNVCGTAGFRLLDWAMARGNVRGFEALLDKGARLDVPFRDLRRTPDRSFNPTVLERVLAADRADFVYAVLRTGVHPDHVPFPRDGRSMLFFAVRAGSTSVIDALVASGASIDFRDNDGRNALFDAMLARNYRIAWHLLKHGADPCVRNSRGHDFVWGLKEYGSRGVRPDQRESFEAIVTDLVARGLLSREDIAKADMPKPAAGEGAPGITVIEHAPNSEAGRAIRQLDEAERAATRRSRQKRAIP